MEKEKINFINQKLNGKEPAIPPYLYKYRPFDEYAFDMLDNAYLFLCQAKKLDDPSECTVSFDLQDFFDIETERLNFQCVSLISEIIRPFTTEESHNRVKEIVAKVVTPDGYVKRNWLLEASFEMQKFVPPEISTALVNWLGNIPERLDDPSVRAQMEELFVAAYRAREAMGICSLSQLKNCDDMWENYADNSQGYCVEYDMRDYEHHEAVFPVFYQDERENNILMTMLGDFIAQMILGISSGELNADRSRYVRMFLTKAEKWAYQKEWRILGDANTRIAAPPVKAIYLGKNINENNRAKMMQYCAEHGIRCI
jgi:hypothetical protein